MAVAIELNFPGATLDQYDQVIESMGLSSDDRTPPGALFHWVTGANDGIRVVDVWETKEQFDRFAQDEIGPKTRAAGIEAEPEIRTFEVHNYLIRQ